MATRDQPGYQTCPSCQATLDQYRSRNLEHLVPLRYLVREGPYVHIMGGNNNYLCGRSTNIGRESKRVMVQLRLLKDTLILGIIMMLLTVMSVTTTVILKTVETGQKYHRLRNESQNACQIEIFFRYQKEIETPTDWIKEYDKCVMRKAGVGPPERLRADAK